MCGRYTLTVKNLDEITNHFKVDHVEESVRTQSWRARYNLAPGQLAPVIIQKEESKGRELHLMRWGLIPFWAKDPKIAYKMINARAETVDSKPSYKKAFTFRRCIIPADGFYEWKKLAIGRSTKPKKIPTRIVLKSRELFGFAGLWETWNSPEGEIIESFTIITTSANKVVAPIHDRMPVMLLEKQAEEWLNPELRDPDHLKDLLGPLAASRVETYTVSDAVNSSRVDQETLILPYEEKRNSA